MITRRSTLAGLAAFLSPVAARGAPGEEFRITSGHDSFAVSRYAAAGSERRSAVIALHGARGIELRPRAYERYADALTVRGIDTYFLRYMMLAACVAGKATDHSLDQSST